ncbi:MAG: hypothetical protein ABSG99_08350 [Sedimentisphaerales bacterium]
MNKAGNNEQFDTDILQCKVDILRARNIIPLHDDNTPKNPETQNNNIETNAAEISTHKNTNSIPIRHMDGRQVETTPAKETETLQEKSEIPSFDLAEEIMAEQRRITAIRRKAPGQKTEAQRLKPETQIVDHIIEQPKPLLSEQEKIIAEIVARDIERLCRGDYSSE